jgi:hypothetical protein
VINALRRSGEQDAFGHVIPSMSNLALATLPVQLSPRIRRPRFTIYSA